MGNPPENPNRAPSGTPPPPIPPHPPQPSAGDATGGLIPYKNGPALTAYYLGIASLIPCLGLLTGAPALILGIIGLKKVKHEPEVKGTAHAWVGIVIGSASLLLHLLLFLLPTILAGFRSQAHP